MENHNLHIYSYSLSLRLIHLSVQPEEIEKTLSMTAEIKYKVGEQMTTPKGTVLSVVNKSNYCSFLLAKGDSSGIEEELYRTGLELIKFQRFFDHFKQTGGSTELFLGIFLKGNGGVTFRSEQLATFASLGIDISLDIYP